MREPLVRLRKIAAERGDNGSAEARDTSILTFLDELEGVVCSQVISKLEDDRLRSLYVSWTKQLLAGLDAQSRHIWLVEGVTIAPSPAGRQLYQPQQPRNVISLHARH